MLNYSIYRNIHIASEKQHIKGDDDSERRLDPVSLQSRSGKKADGGLRAGNLFRFAVTSIGDMSAFWSLFWANADGQSMPICKTCGTDLSVIYKIIKGSTQICNKCNTCAEVVEFDTSFGCTKVRKGALEARQTRTKLIFDINAIDKGQSIDYIEEQLE